MFNIFPHRTSLKALAFAGASVLALAPLAGKPVLADGQDYVIRKGGIVEITGQVSDVGMESMTLETDEEDIEVRLRGVDMGDTIDEVVSEGDLVSVRGVLKDDGLGDPVLQARSITDEPQERDLEDDDDPEIEGDVILDEDDGYIVEEEYIGDHGVYEVETIEGAVQEDLADEELDEELESELDTDNFEEEIDQDLGDPELEDELDDDLGEDRFDDDADDTPELYEDRLEEENEALEQGPFDEDSPFDEEDEFR